MTFKSAIVIIAASLALLMRAASWVVLAVPLVQTYGLAQSQSLVADWEATYDPAGGGSDTAQAIAVGGDGNVYVTGLDSTVKYNSRGEQVWAARYDAAGKAIAGAIGVDSVGNVYVAGVSVLIRDIVIVKYDSSGGQVWVRTAGLINRSWHSESGAMVIDSSGNVCVKWMAVSLQGDVEAVIKYDADGNQLWSALSLQRTGARWSKGLAVDAAGNVHTASELVVKYDSFGRQMWAHQAGLFGGAVAVDEGGDVYVSVFDWGPSLAVIKYDPNGNEQWRREYPSPRGTRHPERYTSIVVHTNGAVYVAAELAANGMPINVVLKHDSTGHRLWGVYRQDSAGVSMDIDPAGNVYLAAMALRPDQWSYAHAEGYVMVKYDPDGVQLWERMYGPVVASYPLFLGLYPGKDGPRAIVADASGHVYVTGSSFLDYATLAYDSTGASLWTARYDGPEGGRDMPRALAPDDDGNLYVTGTANVNNDGLTTRQITIKYDSEGRLVWAKFHPETNIYSSSAVDLALDSVGNIHVAGTVSSLGGSSDYSVTKYNPDGTLLWSVRYDTGEADDASDLELDATGNIYITGSSAIIKYDADGNQLWVVRQSGAALATDSLGNVYVTRPNTTIKYDPSGQELWFADFGGHGIGLDSNGNTFVLNYHIIAKISPLGNELWRRSVCGAEGAFGPWAFAIDSSGSVIMTGRCGSEYAYSFTVKFDRDGNLVWQQDWFLGLVIAIDDHDNLFGAAMGGIGKWARNGNMVGHGRQPSYPMAIAVNRRGNVYVTGFSDPDRRGLRSNFWTAQYMQVPKLAIARDISNSALTVSWDAPAIDFILERSDALNAPSWTQVSTPYQTNTGRIFITEASPTGATFYRLRNP